MSYRSSHKALAIRLSNAARSAGWIADTIEQDLDCPFPSGSADEFQWLTEHLAERIEPGCTFIMILTDDAHDSRWVQWEGMEAFARAYRIIICWLSGTDPLKIVFPLSLIAYRIIQSPQSFIIDTRNNSEIAITAVTKILKPSLRYHIILRLQQVLTVAVCMALAILPVTTLLITSVVPAATADLIRSALLRPWVGYLSLFVSLAMLGIFYPSYRGLLRMAPDAVDQHIRFITPGFTGSRWRWLLIAWPCFILMCALDGSNVFDATSEVSFTTCIKSGLLYMLVRWLWERGRWNLFSVHLGTVVRRVEQTYPGLERDGSDSPPQAPRS